ncbi:helix-turn-helix domain-containing protein [Peribacillus psychrosaccharolyticus]|uniref:Helix-turn-helix domain-containing protein n=1 Tax=Peribacillus psychrosaccharolyticus TaxID=1407 RepID=A0A974RYS9_PERPY|nr:helix-turn-helix domain-containing protein [Peribacillus psychrosaccharolyticus]MEC2057983.1 helix-turn-helix domain-containing protein [Peribacillus psychrosaccharolyticus]MED3745859.1 helix-turn-helix domain-containing protein [Peribacillus psychrosaccharolyticus]QQS98735.1 helix-turn-helix domain-containing protein [Peribacillus psychrosaccharolyticus]
MNLKLEIPEDTIFLNRSDLKKVLQELLVELKDDKSLNEIMTIREAAEYLRVSIPTVRNMIANKEIPYFQRGQVIRLNRMNVKEWLWNTSEF